MEFTNSPLVNYTKISPNKYVNRNHVIDTITPHCFVGQVSVERIGKEFESPSRQASCNYGIGLDGRVCLIVDEKDGSWCSSSESNDRRAVTIECACDNTYPYTFKDIVFNKLVDLCVDICKRNGKTKLLWFGDKNKTLAYTPANNEMLLTVHRWLAATACPGDWMYERMELLANTVTAKLAKLSMLNKNVLYKVQVGAFSTAERAYAFAETVKAKGFETYVVFSGDLYKVQTGAFKNHDNAVNHLENVRNAGFNGFISTEAGKPVVEKENEPVKEPVKDEFKEGDKVRIQKDAPIYGTTSTFQGWVYESNLFVREINGNRVVISTVATGPVTGVVDKKYLTKI